MSSTVAPHATCSSASLLDGREIALLKFCRQLLAARRVDALADHAERLVEADDDFLRGGGDNGAGHVWRPFKAREIWSESGVNAGECGG
jgi:hypothetical protein